MNFSQSFACLISNQPLIKLIILYPPFCQVVFIFSRAGCEFPILAIQSIGQIGPKLLLLLLLLLLFLLFHPSIPSARLVTPKYHMSIVESLVKPTAKSISNSKTHDPNARNQTNLVVKIELPALVRLSFTYTVISTESVVFIYFGLVWFGLVWFGWFS